MSMSDEQLKEREKWRWCIANMERMIALDAPPQIKANLLIRIILPRIIRRMNLVEEVGVEIQHLISSGLAFTSCMCRICRKARLPSDGNSELCPKCDAELDQYMAESTPSKEERLLDAIMNSDPDEDEEPDEEVDNGNKI